MNFWSEIMALVPDQTLPKGSPQSAAVDRARLLLRHHGPEIASGLIPQQVCDEGDMSFTHTESPPPPTLQTGTSVYA